MRTASRRSSSVISRAEKLQRSMRLIFGGDQHSVLEIDVCGENRCVLAGACEMPDFRVGFAF